MVAVARVSARRRAERRLRTRERIFRTMFESATEGMALVDGSGRFVRTNGALQRMLGYEGHELGGRSFAEFTHPDDRLRSLAALQRFQRGDIDRFEFEKRYRRSDGAYIWGRVAVARLKDAADRPDLMVTTIEDVTARRRAEADLRASESANRAMAAEQAALRRVAEAVAAEAKPEAMFALVAREVAELHGADGGGVGPLRTGRRGEFVGAWTAEGVPEVAVGMVVDLTSGAASAQVSRSGRATRASYESGDPGTLAGELRLRGFRSGVAAPVVVRGARGARSAWPRRGRRPCRRRPRSAWGASATWWRWPSTAPRPGPSGPRWRSSCARPRSWRPWDSWRPGVAHEINTPIQFVGDSVHFLREAFAELQGHLERYRAAAETAAVARRGGRAEAEADLEFLTAEIPESLERALEGIERVAEIVRAMKEFAHPQRAEQAAADLNRAIDSTLTVARNEWKYVADVVTDLGELPPVVCHLGELNQVILNLVVNAAHAIADAGAGRGVIRVATRAAGEWVEITVSDTGAGIPEAIRDRIFDPFFTTKEVGRGTGQGLAIARAIVVDKHGGTLDFETEVGRGTTFRIRLPVAGRPTDPR